MLRHDKGRSILLSALVAPLATALGLAARQAGWLSGRIITSSGLLDSILKILRNTLPADTYDDSKDPELRACRRGGFPTARHCRRGIFWRAKVLTAQADPC